MTAKEQVLKKYPDSVCRRGRHPFFCWEYHVFLNDQLCFMASTATGAWVKAAARLKEGK